MLLQQILNKIASVCWGLMSSNEELDRIIVMLSKIKMDFRLLQNLFLSIPFW